MNDLSATLGDSASLFVKSILPTFFHQMGSTKKTQQASCNFLLLLCFFFTKFSCSIATVSLRL